MAPAERLEIVTTDPLSVVDMPVFCAQAGHRIVSQGETDGVYRFIIEHGGKPG